MKMGILNSEMFVDVLIGRGRLISLVHIVCQVMAALIAGLA
jgi:hypothetical protein